MKMKDKKPAQIAQKEAHKARLKEAKMRRAAPDFQLPEPTRPERQRFLIVCEGLNTEPDYFYHLRQYFRMTAAEIVTIGGAGETIRVVERAKKEAGKSRFDQIWVVFDKDDFPSDHFDNAIHMAMAAGFGVAYSNQSFEYWLILHFENHQGGAMDRKQYPKKLNDYLLPFGLYYDAEGSKSISSEIFQVLTSKELKTGESRLDLAMQRAEKIIVFHADEPSPAAAESSTTIFDLVRELLKFV
ncbi:MAG: RloB family protein [Saprospiraceae bacterium]